jgi:hypothetical protein
MKITASSLIRWSGLAVLVAGLIFAGIQPIHPPDVLSSVTTGAWTIINSLKFAMCLLFLIGIAGIYARQVEEAGRSACRRRRVDPRGCAAPARDPAPSGDRSGVGLGLAGLCALVRTATA